MRTLTNVFKALSDETRLQMLGPLLEEGELCACACVDVLEISQSKASRHLVNAALWLGRKYFPGDPAKLQTVRTCAGEGKPS